jgi:hypothetical protein
MGRVLEIDKALMKNHPLIVVFVLLEHDGEAPILSSLASPMTDVVSRVH